MIVRAIQLLIWAFYVGVLLCLVSCAAAGFISPGRARRGTAPIFLTRSDGSFDWFPGWPEWTKWMWLSGVVVPLVAMGLFIVFVFVTMPLIGKLRAGEGVDE